MIMALRVSSLSMRVSDDNGTKGVSRLSDKG
jgi:hypothetical protein